MAKKIKVLGMGCAKCNALYENVKKAVEELGISAEIEKVEDIKEIVAHGVMGTPALWIDGKVVSQGKLLSVEDLKKVLEGAK